MDDNLTLLTRANAQEILAAFKLDRLAHFQPLADWVASFPARRVSRQILRCDDLVCQHGRLRDATSWMSSPAALTSKVGSMSRDAGRCWRWQTIRAWWTPWRSGSPSREVLQLIPNIRSRLLFVDPRTGCRSGLLRDAKIICDKVGPYLLTYASATSQPVRLPSS